MIPDVIRSVLAEYQVLLRVEYGTEPVRNIDAQDLRGRMNHTDWMCGQAIQLVDEGRIEKACRWLGFVQGMFWALGIRSIEQAKRDNKPAVATFDKERI